MEQKGHTLSITGNYQEVIKSENQETYLRKQMEKKNRKTDTIWWHSKHEEVDQTNLFESKFNIMLTL